MVNMEARNSNGRFLPGHPGYKPKGSVNEFQKVTREKMGAFLKSKLDDLDAIYEELSNRDKSRLLLAIAEFFLPKQREMFVDMPDPRPSVDYSKLSPGALAEFLELHQKENGTTEN
jgi:hypothetical protein